MLVHEVAISCAISSYVSIGLSTLFSAEDVEDHANDLLCLRPLLLADMLSISCLRSAMSERNLALMFVMSCRTAITLSVIFSKELVILLTYSFRLAWSILKPSLSRSIAAIFLFKLPSPVIAPGISVCVAGRFDPFPVPDSMLLFSCPCADVFVIVVSVMVAGILRQAMSLYEAFTQGACFLVLYWSSCVSISVGIPLLLNADK
jgi:hypothetical protein